MCSLLLLLVATTSSAWGFAAPTAGPWADVGAGGAIVGGPLAAGPEWAARVGAWAGRYDDSYAIGRFWAVGLGVRQGLLAGALTTTPTVEIRRGVDLLVIKSWAGLAAGPIVGEGTVGASVRALAGLKYRRHRYLGPTAQLELGADARDAVTLHASLHVGVEWSAPSKRKAPPPPPVPAGAAPEG